MGNEIYNTIGDKIATLIKADPEFADIVHYYFMTKTLEEAVFPCCFIVKINRDSTSEELNSGLTQDTLDYQIEIYYKDSHGREADLNKKDHALKALITANPFLDNLVSDAQCHNSKISSEIIVSSILTVLSARITILLDE